MSFSLSPSAAGSHIVVVTDTGKGLRYDLDEYRDVNEVREENNWSSASRRVTPIPADLVVTGVVIEPAGGRTSLDSGQQATVRYTVTNVGDHPVWEGTEYWTDFLWLSANPTFIRERASFLGQVLTPYAEIQAINGGLLQPGDSYQVTRQVTLPEGTGGDYWLYIDLDAHNDLPCFIYPLQCRLLLADWWPADQGSNDVLLDELSRWAYEDPTNNRYQHAFAITYREPDLRVTDLVVPAAAQTGQTVPVSFTVTNQGSRPSRSTRWDDAVFLSRDPSLDERDLMLASASHSAVLDPGQSYQQTVDVRMPDSIQGTFYLLVYTDTAARAHRTLLSDIGVGYRGLEFEAGSQLSIFDLASVAQRSLARGKTAEYQDEGNNITGHSVSVTLHSVPDLQVTALGVSDQPVVGQPLTVSYTVANLGGDTPPGQSAWDDLVYLSADPSLDRAADRYLGLVRHRAGLSAGQSYDAALTVSIPADAIGPHYLLVVTDPVRQGPIGNVFEQDKEWNNDRALAVTIVQPDPTDIQVLEITVPASAEWASR